VCEPWVLAHGGSSEALPAFLPHWDYNSDLVLVRTVVVDVGGVRHDCSLNDGDPLRIAAVWRSTGTALRGCLFRSDLPLGGGLHSVSLFGEVPAKDLAGEVEVETHVLVPTARATAEPLSPHYAGSVLWTDAVTVVLEGNAPRFPVELVDFQTVLWAPHPDASWYVSWNRYDLDQPMLGSVRLFVNARHPRVVRAMSQDAQDGEARVIRSAIYYDVGRSLIRAALNDDQFLENPEAFSPGTIGRAVARLLRFLFPTDSPTSVRSAMQERPEHFDSDLQAKLRLFLD
jgi:hypothetical protein